jgi:hypothetical protein
MSLSRLSVVKMSAVVLGLSLFTAGGTAFGQAQPGQPPAQPGGEQGRQRGPGGTGGRGGSEQDRQARMDQWRKEQDNRMRELLGASEQEWAVLKPKVEKIQGLQRANDTRRSGFGLLMGGGQNDQGWRSRPSDVGEGQRRPDQGQASGQTGNSPFGQAPTSPAAEKARDLTTALKNKETDAGTLKAKLGELRAARTQANTEIKAAQDDLRSLCSVRQEAALTLLGVLE